MKFITLLTAAITLGCLACKDNETERKLIAELEASKKLQEETKAKLDDLGGKVDEIQIKGGHLPISDLNRLYERCKESVLLVITENNSEVAQGSAFLLNNEGLVLTNHHVLKNARNGVVIDNFGNQYPIEWDKVVSYDSDLDYVFFYISNPQVRPVRVAKEQSNIGEECFAIGNPRGLTQTLSKGIISAYRVDGKIIQTSTEITHGSSGGPLFNASGHVIGITTSGLGEANINFALNIHAIDIPENKSTITEAPPRDVPGNTNTHKERLYKYYESLFNKRWNEVYQMYAPNLDFFSKLNVTRDFAVDDHRSYYQRYSALEYEMLHRTYEEFSGNNSTVSSVQLRFKIRRNTDGKVLGFKTISTVKFNKNGLIISVNEQILERN